MYIHSYFENLSDFAMFDKKYIDKCVRQKWNKEGFRNTKRKSTYRCPQKITEKSKIL